jgi:hypothetical protein
MVTPRAPRTWLWRVLLPFLWIDLVLGVALSVMYVMPQDLSGTSAEWFVSVTLPAAIVLGLVFGFGVWISSVVCAMVFARALPRVSRVLSVSLALAVPGVFALAVYRPWESDVVGLVSGTAAFVVALGVALTAAMVVISHAERADRLAIDLVEAE